jgi:Domain of unknown function (DUF4214)
MFDRLEIRTLLATIPIFSTGVDDTGTDLALGSTDSHFSIISSPVGAVQPSVFTYLPSTYVVNSATSEWIGPAANPFGVLDAGDYTYQETFDLTGLDPSTAVIHGELASDNDSKVILNGVETGVALVEGDVTSPSDFDALHPFTLTSGFIAGVNTLDIVVQNDYSVTGLRLDVSGTANATSATVVSGTVYLDLNADGMPEAGEAGLPGQVVFLDLNHDGTLDPGDPTATTDANGVFTLEGDVTGAVSVLEATGQDADDRYVVDQTATSPTGYLSIGVVPISPISPVPVVPNPFDATPGTDATTAYVQSLYRAVLGRVGNVVEVDGWVSRMTAGLTQADVAEDFVNSAEHRQDEVNAYYEEFLHRAPDPTSAFWVDKLMNGVSEETIAAAILDSAEYQSAHQDSTVFVQALYTDVLGRVGEGEGVTGWVAALNTGTSRAQVVSDFIHSTEAIDQVVDSFYTAFLHRSRELGSTSAPWVTMLEAPDGSASDVASGILASPEFIQDATTAVP